MAYSSFNQILRKVRENTVKRTVAVVGAADKHVLEAVLEAQSMDIVNPVFIGNVADIKKLLGESGCNIAGCEIVAADNPQACGETAVELIKAKRADFLMKGMADTKDVLKPVVKKENGLNIGKIMTHVVLDEIPGVKRLTVMTDGGMIPYPTLEEKKAIIINAVKALRSLGYERPSVAVLCAVEKVNPKMVETTDAEALVKMNEDGTIENCDVVGPISYDIAMSAEIAATKKFSCPYCGQFDILVAPTMVAGNLLNKGLIVHAGAKMAGVIMGAKIPIVLTSRGSTAEEKLVSLALASLIAGNE